MPDGIADSIRRNRFLYPRLRALKYALWQTPLFGRLVPDPIELQQMEDIAKNTPSQYLTGSGEGERILFFTLRGWSIQVAWDAVLAAALRLRGADVRFFTCGKGLPLCDIASHHASPPMPCSFCAPYVDRALSSWSFPVRYLRDFISPDEIAELRHQVAEVPYSAYDAFTLGGLPVGRLVSTSVRWFLCSGTIGEDSLSRTAYRGFLASGAIIARVGKRLLDAIQPDRLYLLNGLFFAERIMLELARERGLPVVTHEAGFMPNTMVLAHDRIANYFELDGVWPRYRERALSSAETAQLDDYLLGRRSGKRDASRYYPAIEADKEVVAERLGLDLGKAIVLVLTNILWDSAVLDRDRVFSSMTDWLDTIIRHFLAQEEAQLVIRVHPAEVRLSMHETTERVVDVLSAKYPRLPSHIIMVPPESDISSYALMAMSDLGLVYTSTTGLEMALMGKPVVVAGKTHYAGKGFTYDPADSDGFLDLLTQSGTLPKLTKEQLALARRYAYLFFFRSMISFPVLTRLTRGRLSFNLRALDDLCPGRRFYVDAICQALLEDSPFVLEKPDRAAQIVAESAT